MDVTLHINPKSDTPVYRQIVQQITALVQSERLKPGDKLPTERELAAKLKIARGTVKKAYEVLAREQVVEVSQGRGTFISARQDVHAGDRMQRAAAAVERLIADLERLKFSAREIRALVDLKLIEKEERQQSLCIAAVDCNPEALAIFERQFAHLYQVKLARVLLDELKQDTARERRMAQFELILTTSTHYSELLGLLPQLRDRLIQVAVSPSQNTIIEMASLSPSHRMGVICESQAFYRIVKNRLKDMKLFAGTLPCLLISEEIRLPEFLKDLDVVFVPPGYQIQRRRDTVHAVQEFCQRGGRVIAFDYQIERGSLLHVEERIRQLLHR
ncbi:MAG: GntR family transcriptional regulator [Verrucomicrobiae bacterium]|nr:GntR family transcriptional regulator [Verrucomicrobiae bacterium]